MFVNFNSKKLWKVEVDYDWKELTQGGSMVFRVYGISDNGGHAWKKIFFLENAYPICDCSWSNQMPWTDQTTGCLRNYRKSML